MKYIITWALVTTFHGSKPRNMLLTSKKVIERQQMEFSEKQRAFDFYNEKMKESEAKYTSIGEQRVIMCPKCNEYIDSVKIDSIPK